jgi:hypothetical protein
MRAFGVGHFQPVDIATAERFAEHMNCHVRTVRRAVRGRTFELRVPWQMLGTVPERDTSFAIEIQGDGGASLRLPLDPKGEDGTLVFAEGV